ncbi:MAG: amino acid adenylation domain-containing protein, partial [Nostocaceae cyanobacterium]|nr:amino acid adenylation domain-containing protein [Nostocaceae cyanobacterium]
ACTICPDSSWFVIATQSQENLNSGVIDNLAYVVYTSGSTGKPKGAMNTHRGIANRLFWMQDAYQLTASDRVLQKTPFSFDVSVWEFFWTLLNGACLVVAKPGGHQDSAYLVRLIAEQKITTLHFVPSMLQVFLNEQKLEQCSLRQVICSGEALPFELKERFFSRLQAQLHNLYGPTEAAIDVTYWQCEVESHLSTVPIGRPIANIQLYILDQYLQPVPIGVSGELHIGGVGLARGYLKRPELTQQKFIPNPFKKEDARLYKTGDLVRYLKDGNIEYLGRLDDQVKIRGFRIELGEVEAMLSKHPQVKETVVLANEDQPGNKRLVAYIVPHLKPPTTNELRVFLLENLPDYMVPSAFVVLESLPLTPNGKVDRKALSALKQMSVWEGIAPPRTPVEEILVRIWTEILGLEQVGIYHNFFELGGHSLLATQVISRIHDFFPVELPLRTLFEKQTIADLAQSIVQLLVQETEMEEIERILAELEEA